MARIIDFDPIARTRRRFHWQESTEDMTIESQQDVEPIMEANVAQFNLYDERTKWRDGDLAARIPMVIVNRLIREGIFYDDDALRRWLDDPENAVWRTRPGKLSR